MSDDVPDSVNDEVLVADDVQDRVDVPDEDSEGLALPL